MQPGLAWNESGYAYRPDCGNDVMTMVAANDWTKCVIDRPMAVQSGTTFAMTPVRRSSSPQPSLC